MFSWRIPNNSAGIHIAVLTVHRHALGLLIASLGTVVLIPFVEEIVFRYGVLRGVFKATNSPRIAIGTQSVIFALFHTGHIPPTLLSGAELVNILWIFAFSLLLGWMTTTRQNGLLLAVYAHMALNATELVTLWAAVSN